MHPRRLYAHRGASAERPENTMIAFQRAVDVGVDALELDVQVSRDGVLLVAHDESCTRTTGARMSWAELDAADAARLDAGWGFVAKDGSRPFAGQGVTAPTFEQVVTTFRTVRLNVDLKGERAISLMLELVRKLGVAERVTLASFQLATMVNVRRKGYDGETALAQAEVATLLALPALVWRQLPFTGDAAQVPVHQGPLRLDRPAFLAKCHNLGLRVDYWVVDDVAEAARLLELGADGIMTNDPAAIRPLFT